MAEGTQFTPEPLELIELALRTAYDRISDQSMPPHVQAKLVGEVPKLIAARQSIVAPPEKLQDTATVFDMAESLPADRAAQLIERRIVALETEVQTLRKRRDELVEEATRAVDAS